MSPSDGQYFSADPKAPSKRRTVTLHLPDLSIDLLTDRNVFSPTRIDTGTKYLLQAAPTPPDEGDLLDLGCGYGPIAITLAHRAANAVVWATDVNPRSVELCGDNARRNDVGDRVDTRLATDTDDGLPADRKLAAIYSNPPIHVGKPKLHALLLRALDRLEPDGHAYLVVQKHLGSDSLQRWLDEQGWPTERLGSRAGYRLLDVTSAR